MIHVARGLVIASAMPFKNQSQQSSQTLLPIRYLMNRCATGNYEDFPFSLCTRWMSPRCSCTRSSILPARLNSGECGVHDQARW